MPVQRAGPKAQQQKSVPLLGKVPWFRQPFKVVEPVNGTFLKVCCAARKVNYSSKLGHSAVEDRVAADRPCCVQACWTEYLCTLLFLYLATGSVIFGCSATDVSGGTGSTGSSGGSTSESSPLAHTVLTELIPGLF